MKSFEPIDLGHYKFSVWEDFPYDVLKIQITVKPHQKLVEKQGYNSVNSNWIETKINPCDDIAFEYETIGGEGFVVAVNREIFYTGSIAMIVDACAPPELVEWADKYDGLNIMYRTWIVKEIQKSTALSPIVPGLNKGGWVDAGYMSGKPGIGGYPQANTPDKLSQRLPGVKEIVKNPVTGKMANLWSTIQHLNDREKWTREQIADWVETLDIDIRFKSDTSTD